MDRWPKGLDSYEDLCSQAARTLRGNFLLAGEDPREIVHEAFLIWQLIPEKDIYTIIKSYVFQRFDEVRCERAFINNEFIDKDIKTRVCNRCKEDKPIDSFPITYRRGARIHKHKCLPCSNLHDKEYKKAKRLKAIEEGIIAPRVKPVEMKSKVCNKCKEVKTVDIENVKASGFSIWFNKKRGALEVYPQCRTCMSKASSAWQKKKRNNDRLRT